MNKPILIFDTECFRDYWLLAFLNPLTGNVTNFELYDGHPLDVEAIRRILCKYTIVGFNSINYDLPQIFHALKGVSTQMLKASNDFIINQNMKFWHAEAKFGFKISARIDHIDLIEVSPGKASLKAYGGKMHSKKLQDLPLSPDDTVMPDMFEDIKSYCANDLRITLDLYRSSFLIETPGPCGCCRRGFCAWP